LARFRLIQLYDRLVRLRVLFAHLAAELAGSKGEPAYLKQ